MEHRMCRRAWLTLAALLLALALWRPLLAAADEGDYDRIEAYTVTVDPCPDGSADITYAIDWQVIGGGEDEYLSWVRVGLANRYADSLENLAPDVVSDVTLDTEGGSYARVEFRGRYYAPDVAAANGGSSQVQFAFRVHQSHLFTLNDDGTASFVFTPGWFDDLNVQQMTVRWRADEGILADNTGTEDGYLTWVFGPLAHGQAGTVRVTVPVTAAGGYDPALGWQEGADGDRGADSVLPYIILFLVIFFIAVLVVVLLAASPPRWHGGLGSLDSEDWLWYTNGTHTIRRARSAAPLPGYHVTTPPARFKAGGGSFRGGGAGRHRGGGGCASSCACACASSCACACACAGGGRAGCSAKNFYRVGLPADAQDEEGAP